MRRPGAPRNVKVSASALALVSALLAAACVRIGESSGMPWASEVMGALARGRCGEARVMLDRVPAEERILVWYELVSPTASVCGAEGHTAVYAWGLAAMKEGEAKSPRDPRLRLAFAYLLERGGQGGDFAPKLEEARELAEEILRETTGEPAAANRRFGEPYPERNPVEDARWVLDQIAARGQAPHLPSNRPSTAR